MDANILLLAAGFGTRLRPLTDRIPKPLVVVAGRPLIDRNLEILAKNGFKRVFINLHYLPDAIRQHVGDGSRYGLQVVYSEEPTILDTGGAIKNLEPLLEHEVLFTFNADILIDPCFSFESLRIAQSREQSALSLVLRSDPLSRQYGEIGINQEGRVVTFLGKSYSAETAHKLLMFTGIAAYSRRAFSYMPERGSIFSSTRDTIPLMLAAGELVQGVEYGGYWNDIGTPERLNSASKEYQALFGTS